MCIEHADQFALDMERQAESNAQEYPQPAQPDGEASLRGCLLVLKLAIARLSAPNQQARAERNREMQEHIESCPSCAEFLQQIREAQ